MNYITRDLHGETQHLLNQIKLHSIKVGDRVFLCGDTGLVWNNSYKEIESLNMLNDMGIEILIVDGNHENFNLLYRFPTEVRYGNEVGVIRPNIIHLKRGLIYTIDGKSIFVMGGAESIDKYNRIEGLSWWPEERQTYAEQEKALNSLDDVNWTVDYVITHTAPAQAERHPHPRRINEKGVKNEEAHNSERVSSKSSVRNRTVGGEESSQATA